MKGNGQFFGMLSKWMVDTIKRAREGGRLILNRLHLSPVKLQCRFQTESEIRSELREWFWMGVGVYMAIDKRR